MKATNSDLSGHIPINGRNVAMTSILSYSECKKSGIIKKEEDYILALMRGNPPMNQNAMPELSGLPRYHITRVASNLVRDGLIYITGAAKCPKTGRKTQHYALTLVGLESGIKADLRPKKEAKKEAKAPELF